MKRLGLALAGVLTVVPAMAAAPPQDPCRALEQERHFQMDRIRRTQDIERRECREARGRCADLEREQREIRDNAQRQFDDDIRSCRDEGRGRGERGRGERGRGERGRGRGEGDSCAWLEENQRATRDAWKRDFDARLAACHQAGWRCQNLEREQHAALDDLRRQQEANVRACREGR